MVSENRHRYRLSIHPELHERIVRVGDVMGMDHQQTVYTLIGIGLRSMEKLIANWDELVKSPEGKRLIRAMYEVHGQETDALLEEATKGQKQK